MDEREKAPEPSLNIIDSPAYFSCFRCNSAKAWQFNNIPLEASCTTPRYRPYISSLSQGTSTLLWEYREGGRSRSTSLCRFLASTGRYPGILPSIESYFMVTSDSGPRGTTYCLSLGSQDVLALGAQCTAEKALDVQDKNGEYVRKYFYYIT